METEVCQDQADVLAARNLADPVTLREHGVAEHMLNVVNRFFGAWRKRLAFGDELVEGVFQRLRTVADGEALIQRTLEPMRLNKFCVLIPAGPESS